MKPEEHPRETCYKYTNFVTGVLEYFERMKTRSGSLKSYLRMQQLYCHTCWPARRCPGIRAPRWCLSLRSSGSAQRLVSRSLNPRRWTQSPVRNIFWSSLNPTCIIALRLSDDFLHRTLIVITMIYKRRYEWHKDVFILFKRFDDQCEN